MSDIHTIQARIYRIRGQQVMLDRDLAGLYGVPTKVLNQAVRRNLDRFPQDFMFQMSPLEVENWKSQFATSKTSPMRSQIVTGSKRNVRFRPYTFTEHGVAMLSSVLRSNRAIQVNIAIVRAFIKLRHALLSNRDLTRRVERIEGKVDMHETDIRLLVQDVNKLKKNLGPGGPINPSII
jgi:hypothetical protein